jgi:hypothetical protein
MAKYKVYADFKSRGYIEVDAENTDKAIDIAESTDANDYIDLPEYWGFEIAMVERMETNEEIFTDNIINSTFITDFEKMKDFKVLSKEEFLNSYSYLTEQEYNLTKSYLEWLREGDLYENN